MPNHWVRFSEGSTIHFGLLQGDRIRVCEGDMFTGATPTDRWLPLTEVNLLIPVQPSKVIALWNNFRALGEKLKLAVPEEPLYLIKAPNTYLAPNGTILKPACGGKVVFEGELGIVIGKTCKRVPESDALNHVFGYTCANDVTVADILNRDASFAQWVRAKGFDTFCPFGPVVATGLDPTKLVVKTMLNGEVRQDYPISDMRFSVQQLVSLISQDMTLYPGDIILCGTSLGVGSMQAGSTVEVEIAGIGRLSNRFE
ncbi:fumarylacetoacetate hydrolase family protein [Polaromonas sp. SM01]|uniref:fumarylacetoacetate hydrolase family protein n=1 Tax=Polaromonas sp. SM01 TaxID=3085630 RepID=UPI0029815F95|nr:fumarylacetoacetate hydrolase family protein [Polaromonas sp. SM01]MDW5444778.1 fumarylacetoacetate hydrolase family protein [Polaromonas sp. SM01]